ncbi:CDP-glycerol glycerophosphotransferase family protein [Mesobacillus subterraneus]|uniref:CDP-glycerol glycerophosphotransferase family protein n=1 Tax=Mesobacillus subterraneus TaxID=285983 RepID=A0A427TLJ0_9BACI|nr:CDP-glycerol glycerophosphotransferase family protein [Mesobacillus subterraneus]
MIRKLIFRLKKLDLTKKIYKTIFKVIGSMPPDKKLVVFESYLGKQYSCNPRAIYEHLQTHSPGYKVYWSVDPRSMETFESKGLNTVKRFSIKWLFIMARARYWVSNSRLPLWIPKPKHTLYLQTWHGTPLKRLAADMEEVHMPGTDSEQYKTNFLSESARWDFLISPNRYSTDIFRRAFEFNKEVIESGYPRNDILYKEDSSQRISELKRKLGIPEDKNIILYAPTWRDNEFYSVGKYKFNLKLDLELMQQELGNEYVVLLRMHYLISENLDLSSYNGFAYNMSSYEDIRELYLLADLLITDYSSVFFDYANLKKPMIFYVYDIESYRDQLRGFYFDFEKEAPGPLVKSTKGIIEEIKKIESGEFLYKERLEAFYGQFCYLEDGNASKRVVERIFRT